MRKFISGIVSLSLAATTVVASVASGAFNPNKDPNGDGRLTYADAAYIYQCLAGAFKPSNLSQLDVDDNNVVSDVDGIRIQRYIAGVSPMSLPAAEELNANNSTYSSRAYNVYTARGGVFKRSYTLSVEETDNAVSPRVIIGEDDRYPDWTKSGVVKIIMDDFYFGTAFVVGDHTIATAAHCLVDYTNLSRRGITDIKFFDSDGEQEDFDVTPVEYHIPTAFLLSNGNGSGTYCESGDYALITVEEDLSDYNIFNLGMMTDTFSQSQTISLTGFHGDLNRDEDNMHTGNGHFVSFYNSQDNYTADMFAHTADTTGGSSGSPIYLTESVNGHDYLTVIGINVSESQIYNLNYGTRFNSDILKFYNGNDNLVY